jgi:hypothetical protein
MYSLSNLRGGSRGGDHMVVGFTTTYAICAYKHRCYEFESHSGKVYNIMLIKFVSDWWQVGGFLWFPP